MNECILPMCCMPPVRWFAICSCDRPVVDIHENYVKQSFRNRFEIAATNGRQTLTIPVVSQKGQKLPMRDILIAGDDWRRTHLAAIRSAYGRSAYFEHYFDDIEKMFRMPLKFLLDFNLCALDLFIQHGIVFNSTFTEGPMAFDAQNERDKRNKFEPNTQRTDFPVYPQVYMDRLGFQSDLSAIDLLMNLGPRATDYLQKITPTLV